MRADGAEHLSKSASQLSVPVNCQPIVS